MEENSTSCVLVTFDVFDPKSQVCHETEVSLKTCFIHVPQTFLITTLKITLSKKLLNHCTLGGGGGRRHGQKGKNLHFLGVLVCVSVEETPAVIIHPPRNLIVCLHNTAYRVISFYVRTMGFLGRLPSPPRKAGDGWMR
jgi:hypothetical protein